MNLKKYANYLLYSCLEAFFVGEGKDTTRTRNQAACVLSSSRFIGWSSVP